jgi:CRISPR-associated protein Csm3
MVKEESKMKQIKMKKLTGQIRVVTGLHIGAGSDVIEIGGMDNPIIKNPVNDEPYIPGSSLKGKMRSLMEWYLDRLMPSPGEKRKPGEPCTCGQCDVCRVFGTSAAVEVENIEEFHGPTRLIVRDAHLTQQSRDRFFKDNVPLVEEKHENSINRITAKANPRPLERVVPETTFDFEIVYRVLDIDGDNGKKDEQLFNDVVLKALALLQEDYLGGGGSRGNGKIQFENLRDENGQPVQLPEV